MAASKSSDLMTSGPIGRKIVTFAFPIFLGYLFQQFYNVADSLIVGNLLGNSSLAAVSSTGSLTFLLVGFFMGLASGEGVVISHYFGAEDETELRRAVHTALAFGIASGLAVTVIGVLLAPQILLWMSTPEEVLEEATAYIQTYFAGALGMVFYNTCTGIMRAVGDSRHPLQYLIISSGLNVVLDLVMIAVLHLGVGGAALATILAQFISAFLCLWRLVRVKEVYQVRLREIRFHWDMLKQIVSNGLPAGLQNSIISIGNVVVQSNINAFGEMAVAGYGAYTRIDGFGFIPITSFTMALTTFVSQNLGAGEYERAKKGSRFGIICSVALAEVVGVIIYVTIPVLIGAFTREEEAIAYGVQWARICTPFYFLLSFSHCVSAVLRGAGRAVIPMFTMMAYWCFVRVGFLTVMVPITQSFTTVSWVYPLTWLLSAVTLGIYYLKVDWLHGSHRVRGLSRATGTN
ncbi:MAG: MATE family efflux transporter [Clostridiales bacterium]|nr:MATE family efflux transporter [Clostridiales bacterium]